MRTPRRLLAVLGALSLVAYLAVAFVLWLEQDGLIYTPPPTHAADDPSVVGLEREELWLSVPGGDRVHAWFVPAVPDAAGSGSAPSTVLYCHGNAETLANRIGDLMRFREAGLASLIFDYRGYGRSDGVPSERATYEDVTAAYDFLIDVKGTASGSIVVWGHSLGGGVASWLASERDVGGLVLASTFSSAVSLGAERYPWLPVVLLARHRYPSIDRLASVTAPVVIAHSRVDRGIPFEHGERLFAAALAPKHFVELVLPHGNGVAELDLILGALRGGDELQPSWAASRSKASAPPSR